MSAQTETNKGALKKLKNYFRGVKAEVKKVNWPNRSELVNHTFVVIVLCAIVAVIVWLFDTIVRGLLSFIIG
ncbi:preprotein translocase subunit SecE [Clostridium sp. D2Q-14]|uniref:preprotein translocase subunit SecE n=1 Tax=Anaeromonas gelatinilytica TaxID=2683194 RepID=UPI00193C08CA|nr:preprotein translocase subunit SecE [Anaeromonas gelatinilytica]MBS4534055.1 preprotein translocase subunit SecE [Anaeromonas gelatinilytica]